MNIESRISELVEALNQFAKTSTFSSNDACDYGEPQDATAHAIFELLPKLSCFPLEARSWGLGGDLTYYFCSFSEAAVRYEKNQITDINWNPINVGEAYLFVPQSALVAFPDEVLEKFLAVCKNRVMFWDDDADETKDGYLIPAKQLSTFST